MRRSKTSAERDKQGEEGGVGKMFDDAERQEPEPMLLNKPTGFPKTSARPVKCCVM